LANEIAVKLTAQFARTSTGPDYDDAIEKGTRYWETVLTGRPNPAAKEASDKALSRLLGCDARISGRKLTWIDKFLKALS
jgi:hypothetical protein